MSTQPLLQRPAEDRFEPDTPALARSNRIKLLSTVLCALLLVGGTIWIGVAGARTPGGGDVDKLAEYWLTSSPVIDGHVDLPIMVREAYGNDIRKVDLNSPTKGHFDIPRARKGKMGGFFWSIYTDCVAAAGPEFLNATDTVRDTLEQIDLTHNLINQYDDFQLCTTADQVMEAVKAGKIASLLGVEGAHMLGNSLAVLRTYHALGVRYLTLTHGCNNAFADSGGVFAPVKPTWHGLSPLGKELIREMNRLGVLVDLSHVSDETALQALESTKAPVMWSHSDVRHYNNLSRNVPDEVLDKIGKGHGRVDGVVMVNFYPVFASPDGKANISTIADHAEYIANRIGRSHVGVGSDYDGVETLPKGLEDVSKYPSLIAELIRRGWTHADISGFAGGNLLRVMRGAERVADSMRKKAPSMVIYDKRRDLDPKELPYP